jgi:uncharacterized protein YegL
MTDLTNFTISSTNPCLIIFLIDQSGSMSEKFGNASHDKSKEVANAINELLYEVGLRCYSGDDVKNRFEIGIIGYGKDNNVQRGWEGDLSHKWVVSIKHVFEHPLGVEDDKPTWISPIASGSTPMKQAFENAKRLTQEWINWGNHRDCHPPIIINITDGEATDGGKNFQDLLYEVNELKQLRTNYGAVNILNIHISEKIADRVLFPNEISNLNNKFSKLLFDMSTHLNENMVRIALQKGYNISNNAKGYIYNGNAVDLINFLNIGTPQ